MGEAQETSPLFNCLAQYKHPVKGTLKALIKVSLNNSDSQRCLLFGAKKLVQGLRGAFFREVPSK